MIFTIPKEDILKQLLRQLELHFMLRDEEKAIITERFAYVLQACEENFLQNENKYFRQTMGGAECAKFNPYHSVQYMIFLYYLSHDIFKNCQQPLLCDKIYYLNKILHSVDLFYAVELPKHFGAEHPLGSVMGRGNFSDGFFFYQGCTVGGTRDKEGNIYYPIIEENVRMYANSCILGRCHIGKNVNIGAGCIVKNQDVPANSTVFGQSPNLIIKHNIING